MVEVLRHLGVSEARLTGVERPMAGMKAEEAKRLRTLEAKSQRFKKLVAEQALDRPHSALAGLRPPKWQQS